jgi:hypothetical protein
LVDTDTIAGIVGAKAGLPIHGFVRNTFLVVCGTCSARGEGDSKLIPGAIKSTSCESVHAILRPGYGGWVRSAQVIVVLARLARYEGNGLGSKGASWNASIVSIQARLPVIVISSNTALIISCTCCTSGETLGSSVGP